MTLDLTEELLKLGEKGQSFEDKYAGKSYFPYVTPYSQTNTGFTPAPEANDRVALYFPNWNETHAIVLGAVNNDGNGRFTNPDKRNFTLGNSQGGANNGKPMYDFTLNSEEFSISVGRVINMNSKGTVDISSLSTSNITSTGADVNVSGKSQANISSQSSKLTLNPQSGTLTTSSKLDIQSSETNVIGSAKANVKGGKVKVN